MLTLVMFNKKIHIELGDHFVFSADLIYFKHVFEQKGLSRAARKLGQDSAHLSRVISKLESKLDLQLFVRHKSGLMPTEFAEQLYLSLQNSILNFNKTLQSKEHLSIRVGFSAAIGYSYLSENLIKAMVSLNLKPTFTIAPSIEVIEKIKARELDFAIISDNLKFPGVIAKYVTSESLVLCSRSGVYQNILVTHPDTLALENIVQSINYQEKWVVNDYFVLRNILSKNSDTMGILPESIAAIDLDLKIINVFSKKGKITAITYPGSVGVQLIKQVLK